MKVSVIATLILMSNSLVGQGRSPSNQHFWHTLSTTATPSAIWTVWTDVSNWKDWDTGLREATLEDDFVLGAKGTILSLEGRTSKFKVVAIEPGKSYTIKTKLPLGGLYVKRTMTPTSEGIEFTHEVWFVGLTKGFFAKAFGADFRAMLPEVMQNVKRIAEGANADR